MTTTDIPAENIKELDDSSVQVTLPAEAESAGIARKYVRDRWSDLAPDALADVELIVTELIANAVRHGAPQICLKLRAKPFAIDVAVLDHGPGWPQRQDADPAGDQPTGRGLRIVDRLSAAWGVDPLEDDEVGKTVWASIDRV